MAQENLLEQGLSKGYMSGVQSATDSELLESISTGCLKSAEELISRLESKLFNVSSLISGSRGIAEKSIVEIFTEDISLDFEKQLSVEQILVGGIVASIKKQISETEGFSARKIRSDSDSSYSEQLENALQSLPFEYRTALVLHDIIGYSADDISAILCVSLEEANIRLKKSRLMLQKVIRGIAGKGQTIATKESDPLKSSPVLIKEMQKIRPSQVV